MHKYTIFVMKGGVEPVLRRKKPRIIQSIPPPFHLGFELPDLPHQLPIELPPDFKECAFHETHEIQVPFANPLDYFQDLPRV